MGFKRLIFVCCFLMAAYNCVAQDTTANQYNQQYRPQVHFSPKQHWMNDPNGMVYFNNLYHLFFQYYPNGTTWGPMHWGHAVSPDMIHWKEKPVALYPDSLGYIFSGSAVVDSNNTSGFGRDGKVPMVAIFTHHDPKGEKQGKNNFQNQSLAYSLDNGTTWTKYAGNPVLKNPGIRDFRDPKVMWYAAEKKWVMTLATQDHITFFSSPNLRNWKQESEFGKQAGAHGGVWECPDLFRLTLADKTYWVLIVNMNPGGPNGGSATQYFIGNFDGKQFAPIDNLQRWVDYGPDEYAGVTWSNTGSRKIFLGWMSNWLYANQVPTEKWRNAMTIPRELRLKESNGNIYLTPQPVDELNQIAAAVNHLSNVDVNQRLDVNEKLGNFSGQFVLKINISQIKDYAVILSNKPDNKLIIGYDKAADQYYIDRTQSGKTNFQKNFSGRFTAPRLTKNRSSDLILVVDDSSVEVFADNGLTVMTAIFFPIDPYSYISISTPDVMHLNNLKFMGLKPIW